MVPAPVDERRSRGPARPSSTSKLKSIWLSSCHRREIAPGRHFRQSEGSAKWDDRIHVVIGSRCPCKRKIRGLICLAREHRCTVFHGAELGEVVKDFDISSLGMGVGEEAENDPLNFAVEKVSGRGRLATSLSGTFSLFIMDQNRGINGVFTALITPSHRGGRSITKHWRGVGGATDLRRCGRACPRGHDRRIPALDNEEHIAVIAAVVRASQGSGAGDRGNGGGPIPRGRPSTSPKRLSRWR